MLSLHKTQKTNNIQMHYMKNSENANEREVDKEKKWRDKHEKEKWRKEHTHTYKI